MSKTNEHVYQALKTYCNLTVEPEYAILLKGSWGCGKTHFIEAFIKDQTNYKFLFVSLYGVFNIEAIEDKFFQQLNPILSSKPMILAGTIGKALLKGTLKIDLDDDSKGGATANISVPNININDYLTDTKNCILVFDDLERCSMPLDQILGYINYFVEKDGYKVILIADEDKLNGNNDSETMSYATIKEKLIGKTLYLDSDIDQVFDILKNKTIRAEGVKEHITSNKKMLINIYNQSGYNNLRSLRKTFIDFNNLFSFLDGDIKNNFDLITHLLEIFTVLSMEIYAGTIKGDEIGKFIEAEYFLLELAEEHLEEDSVYKKITDKYLINLSEMLIDIKDWTSWFDKGILDPKNINNVLKKSKYIKKENTPEWKQLLSFFDLEEPEFEKLKNSVWQSFLNFEIQSYGAIKHVVGMYLYLAKVSLITRTPSEVVSDAKKIVEDGFLNNKFEMLEYLNVDDDFGAYEGHQYFSHDTKEFRDFNNLFFSEIAKFQAIQRNKEIPKLLKLMEGDKKEFNRLLCEQSGERTSFVNKSILDIIPVDQFIAEVAKLPNASKKLACQTLRKRYRDQGGTNMQLELNWIKDVLTQIELEYKDLHTLDALVMLKFSEWIRPYIR